MTLNKDRPIEKISDDVLGRAEFAKGVATSIKNYTSNESVVLGVYSAWGSGKTSLINMTKAYLNTGAPKKGLPVIVDFDPWYFSNQDQILTNFFNELSTKISTSHRIDKAARETIETVGKGIKKLGYLLGPSKYVAALASLPLLPIGVLLEKMIKDMGENLSNLAEESIDVLKTKKEVSNLLKKLNKKVVVFIDDIDRLNNEEIRLIFQLVKALADFPNIIYVLSFDPDVVCSALANFQGAETKNYQGKFDKTSININSSKTYTNSIKFLEKIIQLPIYLPKPNRKQLNDYLTNNTSNVIKNFENQIFNEKYWSEIYFGRLEIYFDNIREINRYLALLQFDLGLLSGEINTIDIIALTAIKSLDFKLYEFIKVNKPLFCGDLGIQQFNNEEILKKTYKRFLDSKNDFQKYEIVVPLLERMFPALREYRNERFKVSSNEKSLKADSRVAHPNFFDRAFQLSIPEEQISNFQIAQIISFQNNPLKFYQKFKSFLSKGRGQELIYSLREKIEQFEKTNIEKLLPTLLEISDIESILNDKTFGFLGISLATNFEAFIESILDQFWSKNEITELLGNLFERNLSGLFSQCSFLDWLGASYGIYNDEGKMIDRMKDSSEYPIFKKLQNIVSNNIKQAAKNNSLSTNGRFSYIIYTWATINEDEPKSYINELISSKKGLLDCLVGFLSYANSSDKGLYSYIPNQYKQDFMNDEKLTQKVLAIKNNSTEFSKLSEIQQKAVESFLNPSERR